MKTSMRWGLPRGFPAGVGLMLIPIAARADSLNFEPAISTIWLWALVVSALPWALGRQWPWTMLFTLPAGLLGPIWPFIMYLDLDGPSARAGAGYFTQAGLAAAVVVGSHAFAFAFRRRPGTGRRRPPH